MRVPIVFLILILAEIATFIVVGGAVGVLPTLLLTAFAIAAGILLLRWTGVATLMRIRSEAAAGRTPGKPLLDAAVFAVAALLLILPGFLTDVAALLLLLPMTRKTIWRWIQLRLSSTVRHASFGRQNPVVELEPGDYASVPRSESPWRGDGGRA